MQLLWGGSPTERNVSKSNPPFFSILSPLWPNLTKVLSYEARVQPPCDPEPAEIESFPCGASLAHLKAAPVKYRLMLSKQKSLEDIFLLRLLRPCWYDAQG